MLKDHQTTRIDQWTINPPNRKRSKQGRLVERTPNDQEQTIKVKQSNVKVSKHGRLVEETPNDQEGIDAKN